MAASLELSLALLLEDVKDRTKGLAGDNGGDPSTSVADFLSETKHLSSVRSLEVSLSVSVSSGLGGKNQSQDRTLIFQSRDVMCFNQIILVLG